MDDRFEVLLPRAAAEFKRLPIPVRKLLQLCDGTRNLTKLSQVADLPLEQTQKVVERLEQLGVIARRAKDEKKKSRQLSAQTLAWMRAAPAKEFSADEEQFFEQTIDHLLEPQDKVSDEA